MMTREEMLDAVASTFGLENKWTIWFFECAERLTDEQLFNAYILLDETAYHAPEDDDDYFEENDHILEEFLRGRRVVDFLLDFAYNTIELLWNTMAGFRYGYKKTSFPPGRSFLQSKSTHPQHHFRRKADPGRSKGSI